MLPNIPWQQRNLKPPSFIYTYSDKGKGPAHQPASLGQETAGLWTEQDLV
ncbi:MAG: hypothetical protein IPI77_19785 [Saprospiraceae bacterium]|nr:hypothetical protein [Saprospiraceae bacterium]